MPPSAKPSTPPSTADDSKEDWGSDDDAWWNEDSLHRVTCSPPNYFSGISTCTPKPLRITRDQLWEQIDKTLLARSLFATNWGDMDAAVAFRQELNRLLDMLGYGENDDRRPYRRTARRRGAVSGAGD